MSLRNVLIKTAPLALCLAIAVIGGCASPEDIEQLKKGQTEILAKLEKEILPKIEQLEKARAAAPAAAPQPGRPDPNKVYAFPVGSAATKGTDDAWVTIIEVSEFQCPFCNRVQPTLKQVQDTYGKDVRIAFKHNPLSFHPNAKPAAKAAECARDQGKFWEMHDLMFENQRDLATPKLEEFAGKTGINVEQWKTCFASTKHEDLIAEDQKLSNQFGSRGTPGFFINGRFLSGAQPFESFKVLIDEELTKAKDSGTAPKDYYTKTVIEKGAKSM